jgi:hypothetical protein
MKGVMPLHTEILIYDHFEELDALGPYEVLAKSGFDVALVAAEPADRIEAANGMIVVPHRQLSERVELLIVPGGPWTKRRPRCREHRASPRRQGLARNRGALRPGLHRYSTAARTKSWILKESYTVPSRVGC